MRETVGRPIRVAPGDKVVLRARLPSHASIGRLFIFARHRDEPFAPYTLSAGSLPLINDRPVMMTPLSLRLSDRQPQRGLNFVSDITGEICVMQELDGPRDPRVKVRLQRKMDPKLSWTQRLQRRLHELFA